MSNQIIYKKDSDAQLWADAKKLAHSKGRSLSDLVTEAVRVYVEGKQHAPKPAPRPAVSRTSSPSRGPVPDPFAAKD